MRNVSNVTISNVSATFATFKTPARLGGGFPEGSSPRRERETRPEMTNVTNVAQGCPAETSEVWGWMGLCQ